MADGAVVRKQGSESPLHEFDPRSFQRKVFEVARTKHTIAVLDTGAGKTMIAVMLIKEVGFSLHAMEGSKKLIQFSVPKVHLVIQFYGSQGARVSEVMDALKAGKPAYFIHLFDYMYMRHAAGHWALDLDNRGLAIVW